MTLNRLPVYKKPIKRLKPIGRAARRKWPTRAQAYAAVSRRAKGRCELCTRAQDPLDPHHVWGRGTRSNCVPAAICDSPECIIGLCHECHERITGLPGLGFDRELDEDAKTYSVDLFIKRHDLWEHIPTLAGFADDPQAQMCYLINAMEES